MWAKKNICIFVFISFFYDKRFKGRNMVSKNLINLNQKLYGWRK